MLVLTPVRWRPDQNAASCATACVAPPGSFPVPPALEMDPRRDRRAPTQAVVPRHGVTLLPDSEGLEEGGMSDVVSEHISSVATPIDGVINQTVFDELRLSSHASQNCAGAWRLSRKIN
jgi:hypothetical protein